LNLWTRKSLATHTTISMEIWKQIQPKRMSKPRSHYGPVEVELRQRNSDEIYAKTLFKPDPDCALVVNPTARR